MALNRRFLYFVLFVIGISMFLAGGLTWIISADKDYSITYDRVEDESPMGAQSQQWDVGSYDGLTEAQKRDFRRAVQEREIIHYETAEKVWPEVIVKDERYYVFKSGGHFDWLDPATSGTLVGSALGLVIVVQAARWEHRLY